MAKRSPTIPDDKIRYYREKLYREVSQLFQWEGLPDELPTDYLERTLVREGQVMFFKDDETYGYMALKCFTRGLNIYQRPVEAFATAPNTEGLESQYTRTIGHSYVKDLDKDKFCVLIENMYEGQPISEIVAFHAKRLAMLQTAFDTNGLWQNIPVIISVPDSDMKLSLETLFQSIETGQPMIVVDQLLLAGEKPVQAGVVPVPFILDKLHDAMNEVYSDFKSAIGINTSGADKKERLVVDEVNANNQANETCLNIMLSQREKACKEIKNLYGLDVTVKVRMQDQKEKEDDQDGDEHDRIKTPAGNTGV